MGTQRLCAPERLAVSDLEYSKVLMVKIYYCYLFTISIPFCN